MSHQRFVMTAPEMDTLHGAGPLATTLYLWLRSWMDYASGTVGKTRPLSLAMLRAYTETHTPRGKGVEVAQTSEKCIRLALARLERAALITRLPGEKLAFKMPAAQTSASARPFQTGHSEGTLLSTKPGTAKPASTLGFKPIPGTATDHQNAPYRAHLRFKEVQNLTARAVDNFSGDCTQPGQRRLTETKPDSTERLLQFGQRRGIEPRPGESWSEYRQRVTQAA